MWGNGLGGPMTDQRCSALGHPGMPGGHSTDTGRRRRGGSWHTTHFILHIPFQHCSRERHRPPGRKSSSLDRQLRDKSLISSCDSLYPTRLSRALPETVSSLTQGRRHVSCGRGIMDTALPTVSPPTPLGLRWPPNAASAETQRSGTSAVGGSAAGTALSQAVLSVRDMARLIPIKYTENTAVS